ncbi:hypothetical protein [Flagellimonas lutaonensis]|uniref:Uncharacterized protein n=1 Tax=Flagellimonas lutaonensis TaxID=516051 RepID=A0A0D5YTG2_9FLAO|nr:hypothetical protein [Allomuricauda lutaonensis]AKA35156.1 hypothetical protein VC82_1537 [Allomuricauda lutaonensis]
MKTQIFITTFLLVFATGLVHAQTRSTKGTKVILVVDKANKVTNMELFSDKMGNFDSKAFQKRHPNAK